MTSRRIRWQTSIDVASLAPHAEITVYPWKEPAELKQRTIERVRRFLQAQVRGAPPRTKGGRRAGDRAPSAGGGLRPPDLRRQRDHERVRACCPSGRRRMVPPTVT